MNEPIMTDMRSEYSKTLIQIGKENPNVVVLGADTTDSLKTSSFGKEFPDRFFNVGIAEANLVTVSAGLAASGKISFASTYAIFLPGRAVDQIRNNIAYPSPEGKQGLNVKLVVSHGGLSVGPDGGSHQQIEDIAIMRVIPNFRVFIPADTISVSKLTHLMANEYGPFYMRMARSKTPIVHSESQDFQIGRGITLRDGSDCTIAACGITVRMALDAAESLQQEGISCRVLDMFSIKPIDNEILEKTAPDLKLQLLDGQSNLAMQAADAILLASGTATLEGMLYKKPMVVGYKIKPLSYWIFKTLFTFNIKYFLDKIKFRKKNY